MAATIARTDTRTRGSGKGSRQRAAEGEQMLADYNRGVTLAELVEKYGLSRATVNRRLTATVESRRRVTTDVYREQQNALLDSLMADHQRNLDAGTLLVTRGSTGQPDPETGEIMINTDLIERGLSVRAKALDGLLRVAERRHKLNGTDAPVVAQVEVTQVTQQERELSDLLAAAAAAQAAREAELVEEENA